jgi:hypothetical protein
MPLNSINSLYLLLLTPHGTKRYIQFCHNNFISGLFLAKIWYSYNLYGWNFGFFF